MQYALILEELVAGRDLSAELTTAALRGILDGEWTPAQTAGFLVALKIKGETPSELAAAARVMREKCAPVRAKTASEAVDTAGTGGDGAKVFNISTAAAFVAAAAGARVAKHGNRAVSGVCGSSDILAALGLDLSLSPESAAELLDETGICFLFAPNHHPAMKNAAPVRKDLGVRTLFNLLGPLANPAGARRQLAGVFSPDLVVPYARTLAELGAERAIVVHGGGMDEISLASETDIAEVSADGAIKRRTFAPEDLGISRAPLSAIRAETPEEAKTHFLAAVSGKPGPARDVVVLNAAAALTVAGVSPNLPEGVTLAAKATDSGQAEKKLREFLNAAAKKAEKK